MCKCTHKSLFCINGEAKQYHYTVCIKKNGTVRKYFLKNMKPVHKYKYLISYQSGINALSVAILIIRIAFVNQELCHVLCDETKSRLCHFWYLS